MRQIKNEKNIVPPVAQFRAFSVYEDKPTEADLKKREPTFKPFVAKDVKKDNFFKIAEENVKALCAQVEKQSEWQKDAAQKRYNNLLLPVFIFCKSNHLTSISNKKLHSFRIWCVCVCWIE